MNGRFGQFWPGAGGSPRQKFLDRSRTTERTFFFFFGFWFVAELGLRREKSDDDFQRQMEVSSNNQTYNAMKSI